jgi:hypothetical protein
VAIEQNAAGISIKTIYPKMLWNLDGHMHGNGGGTSYAVRYDITVPESARLDLNNSFGQASVTGLRAGAQIVSHYGQTEVRDMAGPVNVENSFAATHLNNIAGNVTVNSKYCPVTAAKVTGNVDITSSFGPVEVSLAGGSGACQAVSIKNSYGPIRLHLPAEASYKVSARTKFGHIHSDFPLTVSGMYSSDELQGTIGSGRCELTLTDSFAPIEIVRGGSVSETIHPGDVPPPPGMRNMPRGPHPPHNGEVPPSVPPPAEPPQPPQPPTVK